MAIVTVKIVKPNPFDLSRSSNLDEDRVPLHTRTPEGTQHYACCVPIGYKPRPRRCYVKKWKPYGDVRLHYIEGVAHRSQWWVEDK